IKPVNPSAIMPPRWMKPYYLSLIRKDEIEGPPPPTARSSQPNWNLTAELTAFKIRLGIHVPDELLTSALTEPISEQDNEDEPKDYRRLLENGQLFIEEFVSHYLQLALPRLPKEALNSIRDFLLLERNLAHIAFNLGYQDLIQSLEVPPSKKVLSETFVASIEAIKLSEGEIAAGRYILDFIIPQLAGKDIIEDIWKPSDPMAVLVDHLKSNSQAKPEARLIRQSGLNTVTPIFYVGLFSERHLLAESAAESIALAECDAAKLALKTIYHVQPSSKP
uniref:Large ribosomal subunit protein mL44 n=1 Tax=Ciona savignyi TaxID=51511 RepID=H2Z0D6_CIOSA